MSLTLTDSGFYSLINAMNRTQSQQKITMARLSTGLRINRAADDPAGLIAAKILDGELSSIRAASENASRADAMLDVADGAMSSMSSLVTNIQSLVTSLANDSGLTEAEKDAKQLEIDSAIASIDRLVNTTSFNGKNLLNGTYAINTSGVDTSKITDVNITSKGSLTSATVDVNVVSAAERGQVSFTGAGLSAGNAVVLKITGNQGSVDLSFAGSASIADMATSINANSAATGVHASAAGGKLYLVSQHYGEEEFVRVETLTGDFDLDGGVTQDSGENATVTVNGQAATVNGMDVSFNVGSVSGNMTLKESFTTAAGGSETFTVTGGGATFALTPSATSLSNIGISNMSSSKLGNGTLGYLSSLATGGANCARTHAGQAVRIAEAASRQVARAQGTIGAFQRHTIGSMKNVLAQSEISMASALSDIEDTDYGLEVANMARYNTLLQTQVSLLSIIGQTQSNNILRLFDSNN